MFAQLGDHIFQGLKTPSSYSDNEAVKYGQIPRVNDKPAIQPTGAELKEIQLSIVYSADFCEPTTEIEALKKSMRDFEVLTYINGEGQIIGKYVITSVDTTTQRCSATGRVELASVNINLLESPGGEDPAPAGQALTSQQPATEPPAKPVPSPAADITNDIAEAKTKVSGIKKAVAKIKNKTTDLKSGVREVRQLATDAQGLYASAKTKVEATKKIAQRASKLPTSLGEALKYAENLANLDNVADISVLEMNANQLSESADKVTTHAAPAAGFAGTKEAGN